MKLRFKIYFLAIILLSAFLIYAVFFMKSDYVQPKTLPDSIAGSKVKVGDQKIVDYKPDFLPKPIPEDVLQGSKENEFYYYLFFKPNRKIVFYQYKPGSKNEADSEAFHKEIDLHIKRDLIYGEYRIQYVTDKGAALYEKQLLKNNKAANYKPSEGDSKKYQKEMLEKKSRIDAVKKFYQECAKTMCIINTTTDEYVVIDKRDIKTAKKTLDDYQRW